MSDAVNQDGKDESLAPLLPPLIKSIPASLRRYAPDDPTTRGDESIVLDEEDERILDKIWAEVARHPRMANDPDASPGADANVRRNGDAPNGTRTERDAELKEAK